MSQNPKLIIIMGLPATGKTTLSRKISESLELPLISRDEIKVEIMDKVGWGEREWSKKVGQASYSLIDYVAEQIARSKSSFIIETDFTPEFANEKFNRIHQQGYDIIQIICSADNDVILDRWKKRAAENSSHPSSTEGEQGLSELLETISKGQRQPLDVPSEIIHVYTNDSTDIDNLNVINQLRALL